MSSQEDPRVDRMFGSDRLAALAALTALWAVLLFVFFQVLPIVTDRTTIYVLGTGVALVLLFNTASILAMLSHYSEDRKVIYGLDIHYLDEMKKSKG